MPVPAAVPQPASERVLDDLARRTFEFFWETANPRNGLVPDRCPTRSFASVAAVGFGLTAYPIGVERGYVTRAQALERVLATLRFFREAAQGANGMAGYKGFRGTLEAAAAERGIRPSEHILLGVKTGKV